MMRFVDWLSSVRFSDKPWLILGKGPSTDMLGQVDLFAYNVIALNHAVRLVPRIEIAHFIDREAWKECTPFLVRAGWVLTPERMHVGMKQGPILEAAPDNHVVYRKVLVPLSEKPSHGIAVRYFSVEAALGILGELGARTVYTLGIDGGSQYAEAFDDLKPLENGRKSFDIQFEAMAEIAAHYRQTVIPLFPAWTNA